MKAAVISAPGMAPVYTDFREPEAAEGQLRIKVTASALSHVTRGRASGAHYSSSGQFPLIPGVDGAGLLEDGKRVYFMLPEAPFGGMAEWCLIDQRRCLSIPAGLDDVTAAAMAIPAMSSWSALVERAKLLAGETVLINGATGTSGSLAVQIAKYLGASKIIATGRDPSALAALGQLGADVTIDLKQAPEPLQAAFATQFEQGVDVVLDYLWGPSAELILATAAKVAPDAVPIRYVEIGAISAPSINLPSAIIRSTAIQLMGSGIGSVPMAVLAQCVQASFEAAASAGFSVATKKVELAAIAAHWDQKELRERLVFTP